MHSHFVGFVMSRLICKILSISKVYFALTVTDTTLKDPGLFLSIRLLYLKHLFTSVRTAGPAVILRIHASGLG